MIEYIEYGENDTEYVGGLRLEDENGAIFRAMFRRDDLGNPRVFLNDQAIALLPPEVAHVWTGGSG